MTNIPGLLRRIRRLRGERGFTLIEAVLAMVIFAALSAAMAGLLTSAINSNKLSRERTIADQIAMEQIESIRRLPYEDVGTNPGNPRGTVTQPAPVNVTGLQATVTIDIRYVDDPTPTSYETNANYKKVTVWVRRTGDNRLLAREITYVAPSSRTPFGGVNLAIIQPQVNDYVTSAPVEVVDVDLLTGPSAPQSDLTDSNGKVSFQKLTPNATGTCPTDCYDITATLAGYVQFGGTTRLNVAPGQTATPTIQIYRPGTIDLVIQNSSGGPYTGAVSVKLTSALGSTQTIPVTGGATTVTAVAGVPIIPGSVQYTVEAWTTGTPQCATPVSSYVGDSYPSDRSSTFTLQLGACPSGSIAATVTWGASGPPVDGATVSVSGGPYAMTAVNGTTNASGQVTFSNIPSGTGYTVSATRYSQNASQTAAVTTGSTTNVTLALAAGAATVQVRWAGVAVNGAVVTVTGGPASVNLTQTTPASGNVVFSGLPPGAGYNVVATKSGQSQSLLNQTLPAGSTTVTLNLPLSTLTVNVKRGTTNQNGATVVLTLGPMNVNVTNTTNSSGNVTFNNVPVGTGYTIKAWRCAAASPQRSRGVTNQTVNSGPTTINLVFDSTNTCPLP